MAPATRSAEDAGAQGGSVADVRAGSSRQEFTPRGGFKGGDTQCCSDRSSRRVELGTEFGGCYRNLSWDLLPAEWERG